MDLKSGYPFWAVRNGLMYAFPRIEADTNCDVLVIGGGISAALIARALVADGMDVIVAEQRDIAWGSTAASTAMIQYEIDTHMVDLARKYGERDAVAVYRACASAITQLQVIADEVRDVDFSMQQSLYVASSWLHRKALVREFELRRKHGFDVEWLPRRELQDRFAVRYSGAILSALAAQVDPYRLTYRLLRQLHRKGVRVYDRTRIDRIDAASKQVHARTDKGFAIRAGHVVVAAGYAAQKWLDQNVAANRSSYAYVTDPLHSDQLGAFADTLFWESARPYLYARTTRDKRLIVGGADDAIDIPIRRDARVDKKVDGLRKRAQAILPQADLTPAFAWAGTFAETADGLPFFGAHAQHGPRVLFAMAYGGNGITYSVIGAELILRILRRRKHPLEKLFAFDRLNA